MALDPNSTITVAGIVAKVVVDGFRKGEDHSGPWRTVRYQVDWDSSDDFIDALIGIGSYNSLAGAASYPIPHAYPHNSNLLCVSAEANLIGTPKPDAKLMSGTYAHVDATYRSTVQGGEPFDYAGTLPDHAIGGEAFANTAFHTRGRTEAVPLPSKALKSKGDGTATANLQIARTRNLHMPVQDLVVVRYRVPYLPDTVLAGYGLCVNNATFLGRPTGTVLFQNYDTTPEPSPDGTLSQTITLNFSYRPYDWNSEPVTQGDGSIKWDRVWDGSNYDYPYVDLRPLLLVGLS